MGAAKPGLLCRFALAGVPGSHGGPNALDIECVEAPFLVANGAARPFLVRRYLLNSGPAPDGADALKHMSLFRRAFYPRELKLELIWLKASKTLVSVESSSSPETVLWQERS
jgi:hypothetical protein